MTNKESPAQDGQRKNTWLWVALIWGVAIVVFAFLIGTGQYETVGKAIGLAIALAIVNVARLLFRRRS